MSKYIFIIIMMLQVHYASATIYSPKAPINKSLSKMLMECHTDNSIVDKPAETAKKSLKSNFIKKWIQKKAFNKVKGDNRVYEGFSIAAIILLALTILYFSPAIVGGTFIFTFGFLVSSFISFVLASIGVIRYIGFKNNFKNVGTIFVAAVAHILLLLRLVLILLGIG